MNFVRKFYKRHSNQGCWKVGFGRRVPTKIKGLVNALPEIYQPIFGHNELSTSARRPSLDRLAEISAVHTALHQTLARPVRVLDLGCAQGFFSLSLASQGAKVSGVDNLDSNIAVCLGLAETNPTLDVRFTLADAETVIAELGTNQYDLILALSLFHHVCYTKGQQAARELLGSLANKVAAVFYEPALASEPAYWASAQPTNPRALVADFAFVHAVARHSTHLSEIERPLLFCSNQYWYLGGTLCRFENWTDKQHEAAEQIYAGTRRYYFTDTQIAKYFLLEGPTAALNQTELTGEIDFLSARPAKPLDWPRIVAGEIGEDVGWLVRELIQGNRLSELIADQSAFDSTKIIGSILDELATLEESGLYHNDVRIWNIIVRPDGQASLIDYGSITTTKNDVSWPYDVYLSFLLFVREVLAGQLVRAIPTRPPLLSPMHLPEPFRTWALHIWGQPINTWSFGLFRQTYQSLLLSPQHSSAGAPARSSKVAMQYTAIESNLDLLGQQQQLIWNEVHRLKSEISQHRGPSDEVISLLCAIQSASDRLNSLMAAREIIREYQADIERQLTEAQASNAALTAELERVKEELERLGAMRSSG